MHDHEGTLSDSDCSPGRWAQGALIAASIIDLIAVLAHAAQIALAAETRSAVIGVLQGIAYLAAAIFFLLWIHKAHTRLPTLGIRNLRYTPGWAVGAFFVPGVHLIWPFRIIREIWKASAPSAKDDRGWERTPTPALLAWWWGLFLVSNGLAGQLLRARLGTSDQASDLLFTTWVSLGSDFCGVVTAALAILVVRGIDQRQETRARAFAAAGESAFIAGPSGTFPQQEAGSETTQRSRPIESVASLGPAARPSQEGAARPGGASEGTRHPADGMRAVEWARANRVFAVLVGVLLLGGALFRNELLYACVEHRFAGGAVTKWCTNRITGGRWMLSPIGEWGDLSAHPATEGTRPTETPPVGASAEGPREPGAERPVLDLSEDVPPPTRKGDWTPYIPPFTFGATVEEVHAAQGDSGVLDLSSDGSTNSGLSTNSYTVTSYGNSHIYFSRDGRVVGWYHTPESPLNVKPEGFGYVYVAR